MRESSKSRIKPEILTTQTIRDRAEDLTLKWANQVGPEIGLLGISFRSVYEEIIYPDYGIELEEGIDLGFDERGKKILGRYLLRERLVQIDRVISNDVNHPQRTFTYWHEVGGHGVLQGAWLSQQLQRTGSKEFITTTEDSLSPRTINVLERQANTFAARAAAPDWLLANVLDDTLGLTRPIRYIGPKKYCLSIRGKCLNFRAESVEQLHWIIAKQIQSKFGWLSAESLGYRIAETGIIKDCTQAPMELRRTA